MADRCYHLVRRFLEWMNCNYSASHYVVGLQSPINIVISWGSLATLITKCLVLTEDGVIGYYNLAGLQTSDMGMQFLLSFQSF